MRVVPLVVGGALVIGGATWGVVTYAAGRAGAPGPALGEPPRLAEDVTAVLAHPTNETIVYAGSRRGFFASEDRGQRWRRLLALGGAELYDIAAAPSRPSTVYVATARGLYRSEDAGLHWELRSRARAEATPDVLAVAVHPMEPGTVAIGTHRQVLISHDGGATWQSCSLGMEPGPVRAILYHPLRSDTLYVVAAAGLFHSTDGGRQWVRLVVQTPPSAETDVEGAPVVPLNEEAVPALPEVGSLALDPARPDRLFAGLSRGVWRSDDAGQTWRALPSVGLGHPAIRQLFTTPEDPEHLYAATDHGLFCFSQPWQAWRPITVGVPTQDVRRLAWSPDQQALWVATNLGLIQVPMPQPTLPGSPIPPMAPTALRALERFTAEPTIAEVHAAAIRYAEVMPQKISSWRARAAWRAWVPHFTLALKRDTDTTIGSSSSGGKTNFTVGPEDHSLSLNYGLTWDLADLIWSTDQTSIDVRSRLMVQLRNDILDEATRLYFERRRLQVEYAMHPVKEPALQAERRLRIEELTAQLDGLTGGLFSTSPLREASHDLVSDMQSLGAPVQREQRN